MASILRNCLCVQRVCSFCHRPHILTQAHISVSRNKNLLMSTFVPKFCERRPRDSQHHLLLSTRKCSFVTTYSRCDPNVSLADNKNEFSGPDLEILDRLRSNSSDQVLSASEVNHISNNLYKTKYKALQSIPWLQENFHIAFIQLLMNKMLYVMNPIWDHEGMPVLMSNVIDQNRNFDPLQLCQTFLSLLYLGMDPATDVSQRLLMRTFELLPKMDIQSLELVARIAKVLDREWQITQPFLSRLQELLRDPSFEWGPQDVAFLASLSVNLANFYSMELLQEVYDKVSDVLADSDSNVSPFQLGAFARMGQKYFLGLKFDRKVARSLLAQIIDTCPQLIDQMEPHNIAEMCHALKMCYCYERNLGILFENRSHALLHDHLRPCDVSNLMYSLQKSTNPSIKRQFENILMQKINNLDVILVSNLAQSLLDIRTENRDLIYAFQEQIVTHGEGIIAYASRFSKVLRFLMLKRFLDLEHQQSFTELVLKSTENSLLSVHFQVGNYAGYLLQVSQHSIHERFFHKLVKAIPRWGQSDLFKLSLSLSTMPRPSTLKLQQQVGQIQHVLHQTIIDKLDSMNKLDITFYLTYILVMHNRNRDPTLTDKIMQRFLQFTHCFTDVHASKMAKICIELQYYMPQLYEDLVTFMVKEKDTFGPERIKVILEACGTVGFVPQNTDGLIQVAMKAYNTFAENNNLVEQLQILQNLSLCQLHPEAELNKVFHIDFIERVGKFIEENPNQRHSVEFLMMVLNRSVVLECPQLNVPWFHEHYCLDRFSSEDAEEVGDHPASYRRFKEDLGHALVEVLNGDRFIRKNVYSPYYYKINFECVLDSNQKPVPIRDFDLPVLPDWQRVAVLALVKKRYCFDGNHLAGAELMRKRHLEILGFKVIQIPIFDWDSMGLSDWQAKVDYLHSKIYS